MTASPAVPEAQPSPDGAAVPPELASEEPPVRRRRKLLLLLFLLLLLAALLGLAIWYLLFRQPIAMLPTIPVIPGEAVMPGYVTTIYGAQRPMDVAVNAAGDRIYIGETAGDNTARMFDAQGKELAKLLPPLSTGSDHVPIYLAVNPVTSEVYVSDRPKSTIYIYDAAGTYQRAFTPPAEADGLAAARHDVRCERQPLCHGRRHDAEPRLGDRSGRQGPPHDRGERGLAFPNDVAVDAAGYTYVTDSNNGRLLVHGPDGVLRATVSRGTGTGKLGLPRGVAVDQGGRVYVVDTNGQMVMVYSQFTGRRRSTRLPGLLRDSGCREWHLRLPQRHRGGRSGAALCRRLGQRPRAVVELLRPKRHRGRWDRSQQRSRHCGGQESSPRIDRERR